MRASPTIALAVLILSITGCSSKSDVTSATPSVAEPTQAQSSTTTEKFASPESTFQAAKAAAVKGDYRAFSDCWDEEGLTWLAGGMAMTGNMFRGVFEKRANDKQLDAEVAKQHVESVTEMLTKHGFPNGEVPGMHIEAGDKAPKPVQEQVREQLTEIAGVIPDKGEFVAEFFAVMEETMPLLSGKEEFELLPEDSQLIDLSIDGDTATAIIKKPSGDKVIDCPTTFSRVDGEWKFTDIEGLSRQ